MIVDNVIAISSFVQFHAYRQLVLPHGQQKHKYNSSMGFSGTCMFKILYSSAGD